MNPLSWLLKPKNLAYLLAGAILLSSIGLLLTFLISDGQKVAAKEVLGSANVERSIGRVGSALLIGTSSKYIGSSGCADFTYLVFGEDGAEIVRVRTEGRGYPVRKWKVLELVEGSGADLSIVCWKAQEKQASQAALPASPRPAV